MATLVYTDVDGVDRSFSLGHEPVMVGRAADCAIRSEDPRVSRMHARFYIDQGQLWVEDLGSSNGIYVGPQKVQRAPVPIGEIVLIGSLMIRLLPASGTMPPPIGLHGTLAQWLEMERKTRATVEEERNAFAQRVGELHQELRIMREAQNLLQEEERTLRTELDELRRKSVADLEHVRLELAKAKEEKIVATTSAGLTAAEKLAEADSIIENLKAELINARAQTATAVNEPKSRQLDEQITTLTLRAEKAEKELQSAQIRAQGAERNLQHANLQAAKAETKASELKHKLDDAIAERGKVAADLAVEREKVAQLEARLGAGTLPVQAAEQRAAKLATELADINQQLAAAKARVAELDKLHAAAQEAANAAEQKAVAARTELEQADAKAKAALAAVEDKAKADHAALLAQQEQLRGKLKELEARLHQAGGAEAEMAAAKK
ncbi:MAG TPA: FHA domain-containing protein, partial [Kofleriaceae bacterium]